MLDAGGWDQHPILGLQLIDGHSGLSVNGPCANLETLAMFRRLWTHSLLKISESSRAVHSPRASEGVSKEVAGNESVNLAEDGQALVAKLSIHMGDCRLPGSVPAEDYVDLPCLG